MMDGNQTFRESTSSSEKAVAIVLPPHCRVLGEPELQDRGGFDHPGDPGGEESAYEEPWYYSIWYYMEDYYSTIEALFEPDPMTTGDAVEEYEQLLSDYASEIE